jgi:hypothetical protein
LCAKHFTSGWYAACILLVVNLEFTKEANRAKNIVMPVSETKL